MRRTLPDSVLLDRSPEGITILAHEGHMATFSDGRRGPIMSGVTARMGDRGPDADVDLSQTWGWPDAKHALARCDASLVVMELMGRPHPPADRLLVFRTTVLAVARQTHPLLAWWPTATQALPPPGPEDPELMGLLNVRLFNVEGTRDDLVMDTLGLHVFGLPDLQCHCNGLDATRLARLLTNAGYYVFRHGDVIRDGHTIEGLEPGQRWRCRHEASLIPPHSVVVDLDPGPPYAAGPRHGL